MQLQNDTFMNDIIPLPNGGAEQIINLEDAKSNLLKTCKRFGIEAIEVPDEKFPYSLYYKAKTRQLFIFPSLTVICCKNCIELFYKRAEKGELAWVV